MRTLRLLWLSPLLIACGSVASSPADGSTEPDGPSGGPDGGGMVDAGSPPDVASPADAAPVALTSVLVVQSSAGMGPSAISRLDLLTGTVAWSNLADGASLARDPDGTSFWTSAGASVQRRSIASGSTLDSVPFPNARDLVVVPDAGRVFVAGYQQVGVIDLASRTLVSTIALMPSDQTGGISAGPAGGEVVLTVFDGSASRLVFINAMASSPGITQDLPVQGYPYDNQHLGVRVLTWDDNGDELREYTGMPWAELVAHRVSIGGDGGASFNVTHNLTVHGNRACVFRAIDPTLVCFQPDNPPNYDTFPLSQSFTAFMFDPDGNGVLGMRYPPQSAGFEHLDFITGSHTPSGIDTSALPTNDPVTQLLRVPTL